jgi:hypothetical protein
MKIVSVITIAEDGTRETWTGNGNAVVVKTRNPIKDKPPSKWPTVEYVYVNMLLSSQQDVPQGD